MIDYKDKHLKYIEILELDPDRELTAEDIKSAHRKLVEFYSPESMAVDLLDDEFSSDDRQAILARVEEAYEVLLHEVGDIEEVPIRIEEALSVPSPVDIATQDTLVEYIMDSEYEDHPLEITYTYIPDTEKSSEVKIEYQEPKEPSPEKQTTKPPFPVENISRVSISGQTLEDIREGMGWQLHDVSTLSKIDEEVLRNIEVESFDNLQDAGYLRWCITTLAKLYSLDPHHIVEEYMKRYRHWKRDHEV